MTVLLMYTSFAGWFVALAVSAYATHHLYKHGSNNIDGVWGIVRAMTDIVTCVALGTAGALLVYNVANHSMSTYLLMIATFAAGFMLARALWYSILSIIARPYIQREKIRHNYTRAFWEAEAQLEKEGLWPMRPKLFGSTQQERDEYNKAIEELRKQGKLPPVPKGMKKEGSNE